MICITLLGARATAVFRLLIHPVIKGGRMARVLVILGVLLTAFLVIAPKFVFSRSQHTQAETCDLIIAGSTRYVPPC